MRKILVAILLFAAVNTFAQKNFTFSPEQPKPGDNITITYEPAGDIANTIKPVEATVYFVGMRGSRAEDLPLERKGNKYTATIPGDTSMHFIYLGFSADGKFDNNFNDGYYIQLYENNKPRSG